jgi:hypothetical protein
VSAKADYNDSGYIDLSMYIRNEGEAFALANCTFAVSFDDEVLDFMRLLGADSVVFNSTFDYHNFNDDNTVIPNENETGYMRLSSAPTTNSGANSDTYKNIRTIEIDYDAFANIGGINVPTTNTYLGTLRFRVKNGAGILAFKWHESKAVLTTDGRDITDDGKWDSIPAVLMYKLKLTQPVGGEKYSVLRKETIKWTTTATVNTDIIIEFSSNSGASWSRLNSEENVSATSLSYQWTTPYINSNYCLIRILDATTRIELSRSDSVFSITQPWGRIDHPYSATEPFRGDSKTTIEWNAGGTNCIKFEFSSDSGKTWSSISGQYNPSLRTTNWTVPRVTTKGAIVRMLDCESEIEIARSDIFMILNGNITFTRPVSNQIWYVDRTERINWTRKDVIGFDLDLSIDNGRTWQRIENDVDALKLSLNWLVIDEPTDSAIFRALYQGDPIMEYGRSNRFRIRNNTSIHEEAKNCITDCMFGAVFPNPANDVASIVFDFKQPLTLDIRLIDISGATVREFAIGELFGIGEQTFNFDISDIVSGVYYLLIHSNELTVLREISVAR